MMISSDNEAGIIQKPLSRGVYLGVVRTAIRVSQYRFAREALLNWLGKYPGDLTAGLFYAQTLAGEGRLQQALPVLEGLHRADPEYKAVLETLMSITPQEEKAIWSACYFALTGQDTGEMGSYPWAENIWQARCAIEQGQFDQAENQIRQALSADLPTPLGAVTHLQLLATNKLAPTSVRIELANRYRKRWPDCLVCTILLADWLMESGEHGLAVSMLHQAAARDVNGQVVKRLFGDEHPYLPLWPDWLEQPIKVSLPSDLVAALGWNYLPGEKHIDVPQEVENTGVQNYKFDELSEPERVEIKDETPPDKATLGLEDEFVDVGLLVREELISDHTQIIDLEPDSDELYEDLLYDVDDIDSTSANLSDESAEHEQDHEVRQSKTHDSEFQEIRAEFERIANKLKLPEISNLDGRFPVYVIFSVHSKLEAVYGIQAASVLEAEMKHLAGVVQRRHGWSARLFLADEPECTSALGIKPAKPGDAWDLKLSLADLDNALAKWGEMIGAVLIVGGPEIVPFHHLPNPVDDQDTDIPSDNPYATADENYFIPQWSVGRLPGGNGGDASLLLSALRRINDYHTAQVEPIAFYKRWLRRVTYWIRYRSNGKRASFGYTAAIWRSAAASVFRPIGEPRALHISPPCGINGDLSDLEAVRVPTPIGRLAYFNLHGLVDAAEWYGHRDPLESNDGLDYPVALRPQDINNGKSWSSLGKKGEGMPKVVFSEACYGLHIIGRSTEDAISLKFLEAGSHAVVGSTCMSYGSIGKPLIAADLLGHSFWNYLQDGLPVGEALRQAKIHLASEMQQRQGYLDGEDQKTLISFILYGDPLVQPPGVMPHRKSVRRLLESPHVTTICDRADNIEGGQPIPKEVVQSVRQAVAQYLPGMTDARLAYAHERQYCNGGDHCCPTSQILEGTNVESDGQAKSCNRPARSLVTLSKQVVKDGGVHAHYARLTMDEYGKLVKLAVSR